MSAMTGGHRAPLQPVKESVLSDSSPSHRQNKVILDSTRRASMDAGVKTPQCPHLSARNIEIFLPHDAVCAAQHKLESC